MDINSVVPQEGCYCQECDEARLAIENAYWEQFRPIKVNSKELVNS